MGNYEGILEDWQEDIIVSRAKRFGFKPHEFDDIVQELAINSLHFSYDETISNGAKPSTVWTSFVDKNLLSLRRKNARYFKHLGNFKEKQKTKKFWEDNRLDQEIVDAVEHLTENDKEICRWVKEGYTTNEIAQMLDCSWHTVENVLNRIRESFLEFGFDEDSDF